VSDKRRRVKPLPQRSQVEIYLSGMSRNGAAGMRSALLRVTRLLRAPEDLASFPWHRLGPEQIEQIRAQMQRIGYKKATIDLSIHAIHGVQKAVEESDEPDREI